MAIQPFTRYSQIAHETATDLLKRKSEVINTFFPPGVYSEAKVATFLVMTSSKSYTLLLADVISFVKLQNGVDPFREVCPVVFEHSYRSCSPELFQAIQNNGEEIADSPHFIALQIDQYSGSFFDGFCFSTDFSKDPHKGLARIIRGESKGENISAFQIRRISNTWGASVDWKGLCFEQNDRTIRTWLHEKNEKSFASAQLVIKKKNADTSAEITKKQKEIDRLNSNERIPNRNTVLSSRAKELKDLNKELSDFQKEEAHLTPETVNSALKSTLQCSITIIVDQKEVIRKLERYVCQELVSQIDFFLGQEQISWEKIKIKTDDIQLFILRKLEILREKVNLLYKNQTDQMTDWEEFIENILPEQSDWLKMTYKEFSKAQNREIEWKKELKKKLEWVTSRMRSADEQLKMIEKYEFIDNDISIFDNHLDAMSEVLKAGDGMTRRVGLDLQERKIQRELIRGAIKADKHICLVKRITTEGSICFGVVNPPKDAIQRPDPNSDRNEVHIPLTILKDPNSKSKGSAIGVIQKNQSINKCRLLSCSVLLISVILGVGFWYFRKNQFHNEFGKG